MCVAYLVEYACGDAEKQYMNQHCTCALVVGKVKLSSSFCSTYSNRKQHSPLHLQTTAVSTAKKTNAEMKTMPDDGALGN